MSNVYSRLVYPHFDNSNKGSGRLFLTVKFASGLWKLINCAILTGFILVLPSAATRQVFVSMWRELSGKCNVSGIFVSEPHMSPCAPHPSRPLTGGCAQTHAKIGTVLQSITIFYMESK